MKHVLLTGMLILTGTSAFAWLPALDEATVKAIIDGAYRRGPNVVTAAVTDLHVQNGNFSVPNAVTLQGGDPSCLRNWLEKPLDYKTFGSRPIEITLTGQADAVKFAAFNARDAFKSITPDMALTEARKLLFDGHLRVYVKIAGLSREDLRDAYNVVVLDAANKVVQPYRAAFLPDWQQESETNTWTGTMVYYFDAMGAKLNPLIPLPVLFRTEADVDCAYRVNVDLTKFK